MIHHETVELDATIQEFLGGCPRAAELAQLRAALKERIRGLRAAMSATDDAAERRGLQEAIRAASVQAEALEREEPIAEFVEDSVRVAAGGRYLKRRGS